MIFEVDNTTEMLIKKLQDSIKGTIDSLNQGQNDLRMMVEGIKNDIKVIQTQTPASVVTDGIQTPVEVKASVDTAEIQRLVDELKAELKSDIRGIQIPAPVVPEGVQAPVEVKASVDTAEIQRLVDELKAELKSDIRGIQIPAPVVPEGVQAPVEVKASVDTAEIQRLVDELKAELKSDIRGIQIPAPVAAEVPQTPVEVKANVDTTEIEKLIADMKTELMSNMADQSSTEQSINNELQQVSSKLGSDIQQVSSSINGGIQQVSASISSNVQQMSADIRNDIRELSATVRTDSLTDSIQAINSKLEALVASNSDAAVIEEINKVIISLESLKTNGTESKDAMAKIEATVQALASKVDRLSADSAAKSAELTANIHREQQTVLSGIDTLKHSIAALSSADQVKSVNDNVTGMRNEVIELLSNNDNGTETLNKILEAVEKYEQLFNDIENKLLTEIAKFNEYTTKAAKIDDENNKMLFEITRYLRKPGYKRFLSGL